MNLTPLTSTSKKATGRKRWKKLALLTSAVFLLLISSGFIYEWIASEQASKKYAPPGQLVDVGGHKLHIKKAGSGSPTILLEAGSGETSLSWRDIPEQLASFATVVSYDRAGYTWSETATKARSGEQIVEELHTALDEAGMSGPYLLVGHSLGGMNNQLIAKKYPHQTTRQRLKHKSTKKDERKTATIQQHKNINRKTTPPMRKRRKSEAAFRRCSHHPKQATGDPNKQNQFIKGTTTPRKHEKKQPKAKGANITQDDSSGKKSQKIPDKRSTRGIPQEKPKDTTSNQNSKNHKEIGQPAKRQIQKNAADSNLSITQKNRQKQTHDKKKNTIKNSRSKLSRKKHELDSL
ncbi:alpha/beta hydrolase fold [Paenibacillus algorifonticola]|uniref:Alpha/beta hydrolase fold n=1 Tax=Paenibacillus algorifonticola TaxID=684063 RepID=A0A1I2C009_9BACL|nr:alpha/beta hydrolase [Paenibacillus algorifonticola]SFE61468.1 alpha/beta hydrolase fold [Paenibacillus algorifonticola]